MRTFWILFICFGCQFLSAQTASEYKSCKDDNCRFLSAFKAAEHFLETDQIGESQKWLQQAKDNHPPTSVDTSAYFMQSLQSELFYYTGLYQFGVHEADKGLSVARKLKDSLLISDAYFFKGINEFELGDYKACERNLMLSHKFYPKKNPKKHIRALVKKEYILNNLAQLYVTEKRFDQSQKFNQQAYDEALQNKSRRGIPNAFQTFGLINLYQNKKQKALDFLQKSTVSAIEANYHDIELMNYGYMMMCCEDRNCPENFYEKGKDLIARIEVNKAFQRLFYSSAREVFAKQQHNEKLLEVQSRIISLETERRNNNNTYIQDIANQYIKSENRLLNLQIDELRRQRNMTSLQLVAALLAMVILFMAMLFIRRKSQLRKTLLEQKNEISKDLHDDIGSGLSSILINADLLGKLPDSNERQQLLSGKISATGKEVSQRLQTFIWSLNNENNALRDFCEYVRQYAFRFFEGTTIAFHYHENIEISADTEINGHDRKNLFFCIKETLNNAMKHSGASSVSVSILADRKFLTIAIHDDGTGMIDENRFGNGLKNIRNRVSQLNGTLEFSNQTGLEVKIQIPF
ncbi:tetratricopeptide repeat-containing sensor histidine kinase [Flavobacterium sp.]|uniref:ATP-binding protein n=1 Tax=Flavobacterium sp. TaxID=239 RepID=UPI0011FF9237|nr:tetratricopeptide repeat-containing sensor histidine kinase [Flavobacterium sp.]RZJ73345.1 MAG: tetratricopeptide repeat-containing sensor histidine kinase [Flavobacterium sp.]